MAVDVISVIGLAEAGQGGGPFIGPAANVPPIAVDNTGVVTIGLSTTINVLANDTDPDATPGGLDVTEVTPVSGGGSFVINANNTITVTANNGAAAGVNIVFDYTLVDGLGAPDTGRVVVTVAAVSGTRVATISNSVASTGFYAPMGYFFNIALAGFDSDFDVPRQDALIVWDYGDPGTEFADLSGRLNMLNEMDSSQLPWNDANKGYGFFGSHVYRNAGTYNIQAFVYYSLTEAPIASNVLTVTVNTPATAFSNANTIYASNGTDFTGVPPGAATITTDDFNNIWLGAPSSATRRIRLKRGDSFFAPNAAKQNINRTYISDWGDSGDPRPIINTSHWPLAFNATATQLVLQNLHIQGDHTPTQLVYAGGDENQGISLASNAAGLIIFDNIKINNVGGSGVSTGNLDQRAYSDVFFLDVDVSDWSDYGFYGKFRRVAFLGTWAHQGVDSYAMDPSSGGGAAMRIEVFAEMGVFCCTDVFMNFRGKPEFDGAQPGYKVQGNSVLDTPWCWDRVIAEGSSNTSHGVGSTVADRQFALIDKYIHIGTANNGLPLSMQQSGTTIRNMYYIQPNVPNEKVELSIKTINNHYAVKTRVTGTTANQNGWIYHYGNTAVFWGDGPTQTHHTYPFVWCSTQSPSTDDDVVTAPPAEEIISNYIIHNPWGDAGSQVGPVDCSVGETGKDFFYYKGRKERGENGGALQTQFDTPRTFSWSRYGVSVTNQPTVCIATPTGAALTADVGAGEKIPFDYIDGTLRGASPAKGAFKP